MEKNLNDKIFDYFSLDNATPKTMQELKEIFLDYKSKDIKNAVNTLIEEGKLAKVKEKKIGTPKSFGYLTGVISINKKGFGFVKLDESDTDKEVFIDSRDMYTAMDGDTVMIEISKKGTEDRNDEGYVVEVLKRQTSRIIGRYQKNKSFGFVIPLSQKFNEDIFISKQNENYAENGDFVVCEIIEYPTVKKKAEGIIKSIIGDSADKDIYFKTILADYDLKTSFPKEVKKEVKWLPSEIYVENYGDRLDLTEDIVFTIDGFDAKDLDDAISIERLENGNYKLGVHIADVSEYVREGSVVDGEAIKRGTSVYLVNTVIPMLPEELSNGICSLHEGVNRLTLSCIMEIDAYGRVVNSKVAKTIISSKARLVYDRVSDYLEDGITHNMDEVILEKLGIAHELAKILMEVKENRGAMDFNFEESTIIMDEHGEVTDIFPEKRRIANKIIEEFMLITNETIARRYYNMNVPFVYRTHEKPSVSKLLLLRKTLPAFDYKLKVSEDIRPKEIQTLLKETQGKKEELLIHTLTLRSMQKARYDAICQGHFSLGLEYYCHFTSPIRRYPDLQIHRIIKEQLDGKITQKRHKKLSSIVVDISKQSSIMEEKADQAERDTDDLRKAQYMSRCIGEEYVGKISSITNFGIFVMLDNTVEGLIRLANMDDDYYEFDSVNYSLNGIHTGKKYTIGDTIKIVVSNVNLMQRQIDFILVLDK